MIIAHITRDLAEQLENLKAVDERTWKAYDLIEQLVRDNTLTEDQHNLALDALNLLETV